MTTHSTVGASVIKRRKICPGSRREEAKHPNQSSKYASEGTMAHALGEHCINKQRKPQELVGEEFVYEDHGAMKAGVVTDEMADAVAVYVDWVNANFDPTTDTLLLEQKFHLKTVHPDLFGTSDFSEYSVQRP